MWRDCLHGRLFLCTDNTLATWCEELTHWKRPWCWERLKVGREGDNRGWDGWMASLTQWTWVWVSSGSWWWTGRPGILQSMGSQRIGHDWATELTDWLIVIDPEALKLTVWLSFQLFNLLINWRVCMVCFSASRKGLSSALQIPSPTTIMCDASSCSDDI